MFTFQNKMLRLITRSFAKGKGPKDFRLINSAQPEFPDESDDEVLPDPLADPLPGLRADRDVLPDELFYTFVN